MKIHQLVFFFLIAIILSCSKDDGSGSVDNCETLAEDFGTAQSTFLSDQTTSNCDQYLSLMIERDEDCNVSNTSAINYYTKFCPCMDLYQNSLDAGDVYQADPDNKEKCEAYRASLKAIFEAPNCDEDGNYEFLYNANDCD